MDVAATSTCTSKALSLSHEHHRTTVAISNEQQLQFSIKLRGLYVMHSLPKLDLCPYFRFALWPLPGSTPSLYAVPSWHHVLLWEHLDNRYRTQPHSSPFGHAPHHSCFINTEDA